MESSIKLLVR